MERSWTQIYLETLGKTALDRFIEIVKAFANLAVVLIGAFPVPGPDIDSRVAGALLRLAEAFDVFDAFILEATARTIAILPIPKHWGTRVVKADDAARLALNAVARAMLEAANTLDRPAEFAQEAVVVKRWQFAAKQAWDLAFRDYLSAAGRYIAHLFKFSVLKLLASALSIADMILKIVFALAGVVITCRLLAHLQGDWEKAFLSQAAPRKRQRGVNRRMPGGVPP